MNRTIKFRGRSLETHRWIFGALIPNGENQAFIAPFGLSFRLEAVDPDTVGQYVGLYDHNCKEIYEGDILSIPNTEPSYPEAVIFKDGSFQVNDGFFLTSIDQVDTLVRTIIGNIHEDRNLLTRGTYEQRY